jgi:hypothetical protein
VAGSEGTIEFVGPTLRQRREGWGTRESLLVHELPGISLVHELSGIFVGSRIAGSSSLVHELHGLSAETQPHPYASPSRHTTVDIWDFSVVAPRDVPI